MHISKLEFVDDIARLMEGLFFCEYFYDVPSVRYSFEKIATALNENTYQKVLKCLNDNAEELNNNILLKGLLDVYVKSFNASKFGDIIASYEEYQNLQKQYPFENNIKNYMECGCNISADFVTKKDNNLKLVHPVWLWGDYEAHGGKIKDAYNYYLTPEYNLSEEQLEEIKKVDEAFNNYVLRKVAQREQILQNLNKEMGE